jgi:hypothetical protein
VRLIAGLDFITMARAQQSRLGIEALRDLRAARRRRYAENLAWLDTLYRIYVGVIFGGWGLALVSGALADANVGEHGIGQIREHGPAVCGLLVALATAAGLRSGARGGPLALEAAEVQHVLLAPIDRGAALRPLALRQLRTPCFFGAVLGAIAGNFAFRRLPGSPAEWLAAGAVFGALLPVFFLASAMAASGRRVPPVKATLVGVLLIGWSTLDLLTGTMTSPATLAGEIAVWPLRSDAGPIVGIAAALLLAFVGLRWAPGLSLEAARRRATLAAELRFAVTVQDLRTVVLLRRQLAAETPRQRPWLRLGRRFPGGAVLRRGLQSHLRWPVVRVARFLAFGVVAGLAIAGTLKGTTPLVVVGGLVLLLAAFDAVEPLAQEVDHPTRRDLVPVRPDSLIRRHLLAPTAAMTLVCLLGAATAAVAEQSAGVLVIGAGLALPVAFLLLCAAALSASNDPYAFLLNPGLGYVQTAGPILLAIAGVGFPVLVTREAGGAGQTPAGAAISAGFWVLALAGVAAWYLGHRIASQAPVKP